MRDIVSPEKETRINQVKALGERLLKSDHSGYWNEMCQNWLALGKAELCKSDFYRVVAAILDDGYDVSSYHLLEIPTPVCYTFATSIFSDEDKWFDVYLDGDGAHIGYVAGGNTQYADSIAEAIAKYDL